MKIASATSLLALLLSFSALAAPETNHDLAPIPAAQPALASSYLNINVGVDIDGLVLAADRITAATQELADSIKELAQNPNLSPEQQKELHGTLIKMSEISMSLNSAIVQLPAVVEKSRRPLLNTLDDLGTSIVWTFAAMGFALLLLLVGSFWLLYRFILFPIQTAIVTTSNNLSVLSQSLQHTAVLVDNIQQQQSTATDQNKLLCGDESSS